jgi:phospholipase A1/A2
MISLAKYYLLLFPALCIFSGSGFAASPASQDWIDERMQQESKQIKNPFLVSLYRPTYILPFYYTQSPYTGFYQTNNTPNNQPLQKTEFNFQISFKVPVWRDIWGTQSTLYAAYTQLSFWQAYNSSPFFRASNYEPELFVAHNLNTPLFGGWRAKFLNVGLVHQSNGAGGPQERTWNRGYVETILANNNWMARIKVWKPFYDSGLRKYNPDIVNYLGYSELQLAYKINKNVLSVESRNHLESGFRRGGAKFTWSFPMLENVKGYVQAFTGYGQSLNEYNHRTNSIGVGFTLNDVI